MREDAESVKWLRGRQRARTEMASTRVTATMRWRTLPSVLQHAVLTMLDGAGYGYDYGGNRTSMTNYLNKFTEGYNCNLIN